MKKLRGLGFSENWTQHDVRGKHFLLRQVGGQLDAIAESFVAAAAACHEDGLRIGRAAELRDVPGRQRAIRLIHTEKWLHHAKVDLVLKRQGHDLFVQFHVAARSALRYLKASVYALAFIALWLSVFLFFYYTSDAKSALVWDLASKYSQDRAIWVESVLSGVRIDGATGRPVFVEPVGLLQLYRLDPSLFLWKMGIPAGIIGGLCAGLLAFAPQEIIRIPCRLLGWPTPQEFNTVLTSSSAWTESVLSSTLFTEFGLDETQKLSVGPA